MRLPWCRWVPYSCSPVLPCHFTLQCDAFATFFFFLACSCPKVKSPSTQHLCHFPFSWLACLVVCLMRWMTRWMKWIFIMKRPTMTMRLPWHCWIPYSCLPVLPCHFTLRCDAFATFFFFLACSCPKVESPSTRRLCHFLFSWLACLVVHLMRRMTRRMKWIFVMKRPCVLSYVSTQVKAKLFK